MLKHLRTRLLRAAGLLVVACSFSLLPSPTQAQSSASDQPQFAVEVSGGAALFSRFLEQRISGGDRELTAKTTPTAGVAVSYRPWQKAAFRVSGSFTPAELEFRTDIGDGSASLDADELGDIVVWTLGVEIIRFVSLPLGVLTPYASAGIVGSMWSLDADGAGPSAFHSQDDSQFRLGFSARTGLQIDATRRLGVRLEAATLSSGNPFDGEDSFQLVNGATVFDEPDAAPIRQLTLGLAYSF